MRAGPRPPRATSRGQRPLHTAATGPLSPGPARARGGARQTEGKFRRPQGPPAGPLELGLWRQWTEITLRGDARRTIAARFVAFAHFEASAYRPPGFVFPRVAWSGQAQDERLRCLSLGGRQRDSVTLLEPEHVHPRVPQVPRRDRGVPRLQPLLRKAGHWKQAGWAPRHDAFAARGRRRHGHRRCDPQGR